jgi:nucleoside phosphorylase
MKIHKATDILRDAQTQGLRRALIVTALPIEMKAVRAHLRDLGACQGQDGTIYECGQYTRQGEDWLVVVAECGAGTHSTQSVVTYAHVEFGSFEILLFIGVGASRKAEAPIGSVVASSYVYFPYTGKYKDGEFSSRPHSLPVDVRLVSLARKVQRDEEWPERVLPPLKGTLPDTALYPQPFPPSALIAPIVSVEAVSADPNSELERQITHHYGDALALEMEGYGAVFAANLERTPSIIIRGISDMRGGKTPELDVVHQPVAAVHAAAFGFELLDGWGQSYRPGLSVPNPAGPPPSPAPSPQSVNGNGRSAESMCVLVLNFNGSAGDFPVEKVNELVEALRRMTGNSHIRMVGSEPGSFRLLVEASEADRAKIDNDEARLILSEEFGVKLLGVLDEAEYRSVQNLEQVLTVASRPLLDWPQSLPDGTRIDRPESHQLLTIIEESERSTTAVLGLPGSGKSALLAALGNELLTRSTPVLAIKADFLDPTVQNEEGLREQLGLPTLPSVLLSQIARLRPVVLLIDQLDALASYIDLRTGRLNVLLNLVRKLGAVRNVHIVLSARTFEYEHDVRLKSIKAESIVLELPAWSRVLQVLETHEVQAAGWPVDAQDVMRSPQALATFLKLRNRTAGPPFRTYQTMLDQLWRERVLQLPNGSRLARLAGIIAESMAEKETLWLASARFDDQAEDLGALVASGILTLDGAGGSSVGFSHQTVFEHALARAFAQKEGRLSNYVLERESSLFIRPKLWAALTYLRGVEPVTYQSELQALWSMQTLRVHLRHLLIEFIGQQSAPTDVEALFMEEALRSSHQRVALQAIAGSQGWFARFGSSFIAAAMVESPKTASLAVGILDRAWPFAPDKVASLIRSRWLSDADFYGHAWMVLEGCPHWSQEVVDLATTILRQSDISPSIFDHAVSTLGVDQPAAALQLVVARLVRRLDAAVGEAERRAAVPAPDDEEARLRWVISNSPSKPLKDLLEESEGWESLEALAQHGPPSFLEAVWPLFQRILGALRDLEDDNRAPGFPIPYAGDFRFDGEHSLGLPEGALLGALRVAAEAYAADDQNGFLQWLASNEHELATPAQRLFAHALASHPEIYASRALKFLLDNPNRFHIGSYEDSSSTTKRLVKTVAPFWQNDNLRFFEQAVLSYSPMPRPGLDAKGRQSFRSFIRKLKFEILSALPADRVSPEARQFIAEQRRRFPVGRSGETYFGSSYVGSPIAAQSLTRASDNEILNAFRAIPDATGWEHPRNWRKGGNVQLSREFSSFAKDNPDRAARLMRQLEPGFGTRACAYALDAMAEVADPQLVLELIQALNDRQFEGEEFRGSIARAIERLVRRDVSIDEHTVSILEGWLSKFNSEQDDKENDELAEGTGLTNPDLVNKDVKREHEEVAGSILWQVGGFSILPHGNFPILATLSDIFLRRGEHDRLLALLAEHLEREEEQEVWQALLRDLRYLRPSSSENFVSFLYRLFERYPALSKTGEAAFLLAHVHWFAPSIVRSVLLDWRSASESVVHQAYGELVALIAIVQPDLGWPGPLLSEIVESDRLASARVGAAYTAVNLWLNIGSRRAASELLQALVPKADRRTWVAIFDLFRLVDEVTPEPEWIHLLEIMANYMDKAEPLNPTFVVERLQTLLPHHALLVARIGKLLVANWRDELGDIRTGTAANAPELVDLAITLHRLGPSTREIGISLFEDLIEINVYSARQTLDEIDNRFGAVRRPARRRLPRRTARRSPREIGRVA